jgi:RNA polymerase sigma-70 factor (ECF subfamily)
VRFEQLITRHFDYVHSVLYAKGVQDGDRDDVAQRVFLVVLRKLDGIEIDAEKAFLRGVAIREASHARRSHKRRREVGNDDFDLQSTPSMSPDELVRRKQELMQVADAVDELDENLRAVFIMSEVQEIPLAAIAEELGLPLGTVKTRLRKARTVLADRSAKRPR